MGKGVGSLVGVLALGAVGGFVGGLFMPGAFSMAAASAAVAIGGNLFAQPQMAGASSVKDLKLNKTSATFLPIVCGGDIDDPLHEGETLEGGVVLPAIIVKVGPNGGITKATKKEQGISSAFTSGRSTPSTEEVEYFLSCAVAWCEGSLEHPQKLIELYAEEKVVVNINAEENEDGYIERTPILDSLGNEVGWQSDNITHYYGTQTQPVDDQMEAWYVAEGSHAPALRGTSFTVIKNLKCDGSIPNLYGRMANGVIERIDQCRFFLKRGNGLDGDVIIPDSAINLTKISGQSRGWYMTQPQSPRTFAEQIASRSICTLVEHSYQIHDVDLTDPVIHDFEDWELAATSESGGEQQEIPNRFKRGIEEDLKRPSRVEVRYWDARRRDESSVPAVMPTARHENVQSYDLPCVDVEEEIAVWAAIMMDALWLARPGSVETLPRRIGVTPGDVMRIPLKGKPGQFTEFMIKNRLARSPGAIGFEGEGWSAETYRNRPVIVPNIRPVDARSWAAPLSFVASSVVLNKSMLDDGGMIVAATQTPNYKWDKGAVINVDFKTGPDADDWNEIHELTIKDQAVMGQLTSDWTPPHPCRGYVNDVPLNCEMFFGQLTTATLDAVKDGANIILFECGLVVSFAVATPVGLTSYGLGRYQLLQIKSGRWGSEDLAPTTLPAGSRFIVLSDDAGNIADERSVRFMHLDTSKRLGKQLRLRTNCIEKKKSQSIREFIYTVENIKPLSPAGVKARRTVGGGLRIDGGGRSRIPSDEAWSSSYLEQSEPRRDAGYRFIVELNNGLTTKTVTRYTTDDGAAFDWTWTAAELTALFGVNPGSLSGTVAMDGKSFLGRKRAWTAI